MRVCLTLQPQHMTADRKDPYVCGLR